MITLGFDPSFTGFGWCVHDSSAVGSARVIARGQIKTSARDVFVARYMQIRQALNDLLDQYPSVEAIGVESPPFGELWSEGLYALFVYVNEVVYTRRKDVVYFDPVTIKMLVKIDPNVRKGKMFKGDMVDAAKTDTEDQSPDPAAKKIRWNHNEADAYHIARFAARFWEFLDGHITVDDLTPSEKHAFAREKTYVRGKHAGETIKHGAAFKEGSRFHRFSKLPKEST